MVVEVKGIVTLREAVQVLAVPKLDPLDVAREVGREEVVKLLMGFGAEGVVWGRKLL